MIQIIPARRTFGAEFGRAFGTGAGKGFSEAREKKASEAAMAQENEAIHKLTGMDLSGIRDPKVRAKAYQMAQESTMQQEKFERENSFFDQITRGARQQNSPQDYVDRLTQNGLSDPGSFTGQGILKPELTPQGRQQEGMNQQGFDASKISDEDIAKATAMNPNLGRSLQHSKDVRLRENREASKQEQKSQQELRKEQIEFHKESAKYDEDLLKNTKTAKKQIDTIADIEKAVNSGNVRPTSLANMFKGLGPIGDKISEALINKDEAALQASIPQLLEGWKEVFGVRLSDADLRILQDKLPSIGKSVDANLAVTKIMKRYGELTTLRHKIATDIKKSNKGLRPLGYADMVEERFDDMIKPVELISPKTGKPISVPAYKVSAAISAGAKLANE